MCFAIASWLLHAVVINKDEFSVTWQYKYTADTIFFSAFTEGEKHVDVMPAIYGTNTDQSW